MLSPLKIWKIRVRAKILKDLTTAIAFMSMKSMKMRPVSANIQELIYLSLCVFEMFPELNSFESLLSDSDECYNKTNRHCAQANVKNYIQICRDSLPFRGFLAILEAYKF